MKCVRERENGDVGDTRKCRPIRRRNIKLAKLDMTQHNETPAKSPQSGDEWSPHHYNLSNGNRKAHSTTYCFNQPSRLNNTDNKRTTTNEQPRSPSSSISHFIPSIGHTVDYHNKQHVPRRDIHQHIVLHTIRERNIQTTTCICGCRHNCVRWTLTIKLLVQIVVDHRLAQ